MENTQKAIETYQIFLGMSQDNSLKSQVENHLKKLTRKEEKTEKEENTEPES